ncbi:SLC13 family permease [Salinicoccus halitifaciens]|uniref:Sodium-dependent dicarboxylate transporter SdcS n=1 Tax=Salinicoccus halitifaciens TaxID=1073415 RepID=A0ABV2EAV2_9STAP|nr:SLC13 family permease [Salinicoccus halitifaciens]MCD2137595.1 anion permease [Salinicoccus halitifaciens]
MGKNSKESPRKNSSLAGNQIWKWAITLLLPMIIALIPVTDIFTSDIKWFLVITVMAVAIMATGVIPLIAISLALPILYFILLDIPTSLALSPWTGQIPWLVLGGFIVTIASQKTGLLNRLAYHSILLFGGNFKGIIFGLLIVGILLAAVIADPSAKAILLGTLTLGICTALNLELGSKSAAALGATVIAVTLGPSFLFSHAIGNMVVFEVASDVGVSLPPAPEYFTHMLIPQLIYILLTVLVIFIVFKPDEKIESKQYFKEQLKQLGPMRINEKKLVAITILLIFAILTSGIHGIDVGWLFAIAAILMFLPGIALVKEEDLSKVNFTIIFFAVACLSIGLVSVELGVAGLAQSLASPWLRGGGLEVIPGIWMFGFLINFLLTPLAGWTAFTAPLVELARDLNINPLPVLYSYIQGLEQVLFPYEYATLLIIFGFGMMSMGQFIKYNLVRAVISGVAIAVLFIPYWYLIGLL